jgi:lysophospholipase L1-like esterase
MINAEWRLVLSIIIMTVIFTCGGKPREQLFSKTVVFLGDSVTYGYGVDTRKESFFARIESTLKKGKYGNIRVINAGVNGDETSDALLRIDTDVLAKEPDIVVISFGLNDCQNSVMTRRQFRKNLEAIVDKIEPKAEVILSTSNTFLETDSSLWKELNNLLDQYMEEIRTIAREKTIQVIDVHTAWKDYLYNNPHTTESLYIDFIHPSAQGHKLIFEIYMGVLGNKLLK